MPIEFHMANLHAADWNGTPRTPRTPQQEHDVLPTYQPLALQGRKLQVRDRWDASSTQAIVCMPKLLRYLDFTGWHYVDKAPAFDLSLYHSVLSGLKLRDTLRKLHEFDRKTAGLKGLYSNA